MLSAMLFYRTLDERSFIKRLMNEYFDQETFIVAPDEQTKIDKTRFFASVDNVPTHAITMGIKNIMQSKKIVLIATGKHKAKVIEEVVEGNVTEHIPATVYRCIRM